MTALFILLGIIGGLILLVIIFGFLSSRHVKMEKSIEITTTAEKAFEQMIDTKNFVYNWSPWTEMDPNAEQRFSGPDRSVGSIYTWKGDKKKVGSGSMEIISFETNKNVISRLKFDGRGESDVAFYIQDIGNGSVKVTWDFKADNKFNPIARIFGRFMDKFLGPDYERGLKKLKVFLEK
jgi:hypothetical protein